MKFKSELNLFSHVSYLLCADVPLSITYTDMDNFALLRERFTVNISPGSGSTGISGVS